MSHDEIIKYFGTNAEASKQLACSKSLLSRSRYGRVVTPIQIRAFHVSGGVLALDEIARRKYHYLMGRDIAA